MSVSVFPQSRPRIMVDSHMLYNGSHDMRVNGSVTPVDFKVVADAKNDLFIVDIILMLYAVKIDINKAAECTGFSQAIPNGLTNGIVMGSVIGGVNRMMSPSPVKRIGDFWMWVKDATDIVNVVGIYVDGSDMLRVRIDTEIPTRLQAGTEDHIYVRIADNLTHTDFKLFHAHAHAYLEL